MSFSVSKACLFGHTGFLGPDIQLDTGITKSNDCKDLCDQNQNCLSWTFDLSEQLCHLKASVNMPKYLDTTLTSGLKNCSTTMPDCYEESTDFLRYSFARQYNLDWNGCKELCDQTTGCSHLTYDPRPPICYLKNQEGGKADVAAVISSTDGCIMQFEGQYKKCWYL